MIKHVCALFTLLAPVAFAGSCSIAGTTTIGAGSATSTSIPCKTFTGHVAVATDAGESFSLGGIEEIQGSLDIIDVQNLQRLDLGDLQKVDRFRIINSQISGMTYPSLHGVEVLEWDSLLNFVGDNGNPRIKNATQISVVSTGIKDLSDVFDLETADSIYVSDNSHMKTVTLPNLKYVVDELHILENGASVAISFPSLKWAHDILIQDIGSTNKWTLDWDGVLGTLDLPQLFEVTGDLLVQYNYKLGTINVPQLYRVRGDVKVEYNTEIDPMPFESLSSVGGDLIYTGRFTSLSSPIRSTLGQVRLATTLDFDCAHFAHSAHAYEGGFTCASATSSLHRRVWRPTPTPTPTPLARNSDRLSDQHGLHPWEIGLICMAAGVVGLTIVAREVRRQWCGARRKVNIPVVNGVGGARRKEPEPEPGPPFTVLADGALSVLPPPVTAMAPPPRYSEEFGKTGLEEEYRRRV